MKKDERPYYFITPPAISGFLIKIFESWGYYVEQRFSFESESRYLKINLNTKEDPRMLHVRISNHPISPNSATKTDYEIYASFFREDAIDYLKFLSKMSEELHKELPKVCLILLRDDHSRKKYITKMQENRKLHEQGKLYQHGTRLYVA